jgi:biotin synthase
MVGLPGQTDEDLAGDIQLFVQYDFDMIGIGPFIVHPQTPLAGAANGQLIQTLKVLAITRIVTRDANLPATTAAGVLDQNGRRQALLAGANVIMPDITPPIYRQHYQIYPGKAQMAAGSHALTEMISSLGRRISQGPGSRIRSRNI